MDIGEFQRACAGLVKGIDQKNGIERDSQMGLAQLMEELGELARELNSTRLRKKEPERESLEEEFADVFLLLFALAEMHGVDVEGAVEAKRAVLRERHGI